MSQKYFMTIRKVAKLIFVAYAISDIGRFSRNPKLQFKVVELINSFMNG